MSIPSTLAALGYGTATLVVLLASYGALRRSAAGDRALRLLVACVAAWNGACALTLVAPADPAFVLRDLALLCSLLAAPCWLVAVARLQGWRRPMALGLLALEPLAVVAWAVAIPSRIPSGVPDGLALVSALPVSVLHAHQVYEALLLVVGASLAIATGAGTASGRSVARRTAVSAIPLLVSAALALVQPAGLGGFAPPLAPLVFAAATLLLLSAPHAEEALDLVPVALETIFRSISDGVVVVDIRGRIADVNPVASRLFGRRREDALGMAAVDFFSVQPGLIRMLFESAVPRSEVALHSPRGNREFELQISTLRDARGGEAGRLIVFHDISELRGAEAELRLSEARKAAILNSALDCMVTVDSRGIVVEFNPAAERTFRESRDRMIGSPVPDRLIPPEQRAEFRAAMARLSELELSWLFGRRVEVSAIRSDGERFPAEVAIFPIHHGAETLFTVYLRDLTDRKQAEHLKDELIATVSHELRTPLTSLRGFAELLLKRELPPERQQRFIGIIHNEALRLNRLIDDLLDLKSIEAGRIRYSFGLVDLQPLLADVVDAAAGGSASHTFRLSASLDLPPVHADRDRLRQVVSNLISNAVKFSPEGGTVRVSARRDGAEVVVSVSDEGIGMSSETIEHLFTRFYRAEEAAQRKIRGTGLGLALVKEIVEAHGGRVSVESEPGSGTRVSFTLRIPAADADPKTESDTPHDGFRLVEPRRPRAAHGPS
jgi:PAS domain S-box-containing protein